MADKKRKDHGLSGNGLPTDKTPWKEIPQDGSVQKELPPDGSPQKEVPLKGTSQKGISRSTMRHATPPGENQKFIKNDQYFTICIYIFVLVVCSAVAIRAIISLDQTKAFLGGLFRALGPFLIALLIAYILNPFVRVTNRCLRSILKKCRVKKIYDKPLMVFSMLLVYLLALGLIITILIYVLPEVVRNIAELIGNIPGMYRELLNFLNTLQERFPNVDFSSITNMLQDTQADLTASLRDVAGDMIPALYTASVSIVSWFANFLIAIIVSIYMLYGKHSLKHILKILLYSFIPEKKLATVKVIVVECNNIFSQYLVSKMVDSLIIGVLCAILMAILRLPYVLLISVIVGITNMIPYFGPFIGAIPGIVIILTISPIKALIFMIMILALQQFDGLVLGPKLLGNSTGMKPLWIIFAITLGGKFFGVVGMFLGVPVMATLSYLAGLYMSYRLSKKGLTMDDLE